MPRFIDRVLAHGVTPATPDSLTGEIDVEDLKPMLRETAAKRWPGKEQSDERIDALAKWAAAHPKQIGPAFDVTELIGVPVIAADDVARYTAALGELDVTDAVASMAPPLDRFWVDFDRAADPTSTGLRAWGCLVESVAPESIPATYSEPMETPPRWVLIVRLFLEREKNHPVGPVATQLIGLAEDGTLYRHPDGEPFWAGGLSLSSSGQQWTSPDETDRVTWEASTVWVTLVFPALMAISFMHCRNVTTSIVEPPAKLSARHRQRHGLPLVRYVVLDIEPMRRVLEDAGGTDASGMRKALHICRGHFKVFGPDAPLFGRHTGTWWWPPQVRGAAERGEVVKDYRVAAALAVGRSWTDAPTEIPNAPVSGDQDDPDRQGRGLVAHNRTVNRLASDLTEAGLEPLRSAPSEPNYDLAFQRGEALYVIEVKSLTDANEEHQLRLGLGQVLRYRQRLTADGHDLVVAVLAGSRAPMDRSWISMCEDLDGVLVVSPDDWSARLQLDSA